MLISLAPPELIQNLTLKGVVFDFYNKLLESKRKPESIAYSIDGFKIIVFAIIKNDDEETEDAIHIAAAKTNALYYNYGLNIDCDIFEQEDNVSTPKDYITIHF